MSKRTEPVREEGRIRVWQPKGFEGLEVFKRDTNISPHGYLTSARIARAKVLLARSTSFAQAALEIGLADQSHLNRVFKKYVLVTPRQYQKDSRQTPTLL